MVYRFFVGGKKGGKKNDCSRSFGGKRFVLMLVVMVIDIVLVWFFKVIVGEW